MIARLTFSLFGVFMAGSSAFAVPANEVSPLLGLYTGDALRASTLGGLSYTYHLNNTFWIGADFQGGEISVDEPNGLNLKSGQKYILTDAVLSWNIPSLLGATLAHPSGGFASDLYTSLGGGQIWMGDRSTPVGIIGGGLLIHFPMTWIAVRFDLKGLFFSLSNAQGSDFNVDSLLSLGPSFIF